MDIEPEEPKIISTGESTVDMNEDMRRFIVLSINQIEAEADNNIAEANDNEIKIFQNKISMNDDDKKLLEILIQPMHKNIEDIGRELQESFTRLLIKNDEDLDDDETESIIRALAKKRRDLGNDEDSDNYHLNKLKNCNLCGKPFLPKTKQKYCEECQEYISPMYRDLQRDRTPLYDLINIKTPLTYVERHLSDILSTLFFIDKALTLDYDAIINFRATSAVSYFMSRSKAILELLSGSTSEIVQRTSLNYFRIIIDAVIMNQTALNKSIFKSFIGTIYLKPCRICNKPLITIKPLSKNSKQLFQDSLDDWSVKQVIDSEQIDEIKKSVVINKKYQTKYHPKCKKNKNADYQQAYKRKRRKKEKELRNESIKLIYDGFERVKSDESDDKVIYAFDELIKQSSTGKGTSKFSSHIKNDDKSEKKEIQAEMKRLGLRK
jgi:hypothetical protein